MGIWIKALLCDIDDNFGSGNGSDFADSPQQPDDHDVPADVPHLPHDLPPGVPPDVPLEEWNLAVEVIGVDEVLKYVDMLGDDFSGALHSKYVEFQNNLNHTVTHDATHEALPEHVVSATENFVATYPSDDNAGDRMGDSAAFSDIQDFGQSTGGGYSTVASHGPHLVSIGEDGSQTDSYGNVWEPPAEDSGSSFTLTDADLVPQQDLMIVQNGFIPGFGATDDPRALATSYAYRNQMTATEMNDFMKSNSDWQVGVINDMVNSRTVDDTGRGQSTGSGYTPAGDFYRGDSRIDQAIAADQARDAVWSVVGSGTGSSISSNAAEPETYMSIDTAAETYSLLNRHEVPEQSLQVEVEGLENRHPASATTQTSDGYVTTVDTVGDHFSNNWGGENRTDTNSLSAADLIGLAVSTPTFQNYNQAHGYYMAHPELLDANGNYSWNGQSFKAANADQTYTPAAISAAATYLNKAPSAVTSADMQGFIVGTSPVTRDDAGAGRGYGYDPSKDLPIYTFTSSTQSQTALETDSVNTSTSLVDRATNLVINTLGSAGQVINAFVPGTDSNAAFANTLVKAGQAGVNLVTNAYDYYTNANTNVAADIRAAASSLSSSSQNVTLPGAINFVVANTTDKAGAFVSKAASTPFQRFDAVEGAGDLALAAVNLANIPILATGGVALVRATGSAASGATDFATGALVRASDVFAGDAANAVATRTGGKAAVDGSWDAMNISGASTSMRATEFVPAASVDDVSARVANFDITAQEHNIINSVGNARAGVDNFQVVGVGNNLGRARQVDGISSIDVNQSVLDYQGVVRTADGSLAEVSSGVGKTTLPKAGSEEFQIIGIGGDAPAVLNHEFGAHIMDYRAVAADPTNPSLLRIIDNPLTESTAPYAKSFTYTELNGFKTSAEEFSNSYLYHMAIGDTQAAERVLTNYQGTLNMADSLFARVEAGIVPGQSSTLIANSLDAGSILNRNSGFSAISFDVKNADGVIIRMETEVPTAVFNERGVSGVSELINQQMLNAVNGLDAYQSAFSTLRSDLNQLWQHYLDATAKKATGSGG